jgi:hypothetical protein
MNLLLEVLNDACPASRAWACRTLGRLGTMASRAAPALWERLADPHSKVREAAATALSTVAPGISSLPTRPCQARATGQACYAALWT